MEKFENFCKICGKAHPTGACQEIKHEKTDRIELQEIMPETEKILSEFQEFVSKHQDMIENELQAGHELWKIFYDNFYNKDIDNLKYREGDPDFENLKQKYQEKVNFLKDRMGGKAGFLNNMPKEVRDQIAWIDDGYWLRVGSIKSFKEDRVYRFYLNTKPETSLDIFSDLVKNTAGLNIELKVPSKAEPDSFNRFDKIVIYFSPSEREKNLSVIEKIWQKYQHGGFNNEVPRFTNKIKNSFGKEMIGISFSEEPLFRNESFGSIRSKILAEIYNEAKMAGNLQFDFNNSFVKACEKYKVDPKNPAHNLK